MNLIGIQVFIAIFGLSMIYFTYISYKKKYFNIFSYLSWILVFSAIILSSLFPKIFTPFVNYLQIGRLFDLFIIIGILFLVIITYLNFIFIQKLKRKMEKLVQEKALNDDENKQ
jgi:hypothetical protein